MFLSTTNIFNIQIMRCVRENGIGPTSTLTDEIGIVSNSPTLSRLILPDQGVFGQDHPTTQQPLRVFQEYNKEIKLFKLLLDYY